MTSYLVLEDGSIYPGQGFGAQKNTYGEVVFTTGMVGYQEAITDQSYANQILVFTNPLIGNYGVNEKDNESHHPQIKGIICHQLARYPSNWQMKSSLPEFLTHHQIPGIQGIDTRSLVKKLRQHGTLRGIIMDHLPQTIDVNRLKVSHPTNKIIPQVSITNPYAQAGTGKKIVVVDFGLKASILHELSKRHCQIIVLPYHASADEVLRLHPDGVLLSNGPGDPNEMKTAAQMVAEVEQHVPVFGICMGHQIFALANGATTYKMKFGHRGFNHPVRNLHTGKIAFTSQNHGFAVDKDSIKQTNLSITHIEINDGSIEGLKHNTYPAFSVQFHPDAAPGPHDADQLFDKFMHLIDNYKEAYQYAQTH